MKLVICDPATDGHTGNGPLQHGDHGEYGIGTKRSAVIADETHSSQTGEAASKLKQVLTAEEWQEVQDGGEVGIDDVLRAQMTGRVAEQAITYVAFTGLPTPKAKTLELFGRRPNPEEPASDDNKPEAFHVYSMRQA